MGFNLTFFPAGGEARRPGAVEQGDDGAAENGGTAAAAEELSPTVDDVVAGDDGGVESPLARRGGTPEAHPGTHLS